MKKFIGLILLVIFFCSSSYAASLKLTWKNATEREDNTEMQLDLSGVYELRKTSMYEVDCDTGEVIRDIFSGQTALPGFLTYKTWEGELGICVRLTVTDREDRTSRLSPIMRPWDATQPRQPACACE